MHANGSARGRLRVVSFCVRTAIRLMVVPLAVVLSMFGSVSAAATGPEHTVTFQQGTVYTGSTITYSGTSDTYIREDDPDEDYADDIVLKWVSSSSDVMVAMVRFDSIFGGDVGMIPPGSRIAAASLYYRAQDGGDAATLCESAVTWGESVTWNEFGGDAGVDLSEYGNCLGTASGVSSSHTVDVTTSLRRWSGSRGANNGWLFMPSGSNRVEVRSSEYGSSCSDFQLRPALTVTYTANAVPLAAADPVGGVAYATGEDTPLTVDATAGVLANDSDGDGDPLTAVLVSGTTHGELTLNVDGSFTYLPDQGFSGSDSFTYKADDGVAYSEPATATILVAAANDPPELGPIGSQWVDELEELEFAAVATDPNLPEDTLTFSLSGAVPQGASIDPAAGAFAWTPGEADGGASFTFIVQVCDGGTPSLCDSEEIAVTVNDVNVAPALSPIGSQAVDELETLSFTATAFDSDLPENALTFSLGGNVRDGASIDASSGAFSWTPGEGDGGTVHTFTLAVCDDGAPSLCASEEITVTVNDVNEPPELGVVGGWSVDELDELTFVATADDGDVPADTLTFSLSGSVPTGAGIDATTGAFSWVPTEEQGYGAYAFTVVVCDSGTPSRCDSEEIAVTVGEVNVAPELREIGGLSVNELDELTFAATATDADLPPNPLAFSLTGVVPEGASMDVTTGSFSWTPSEEQGYGVYAFTVQVCDGGVPSLCDEEAVAVTVAETNQAPVLAAIGDRSVDELVALTFTATAEDSDVGDTLTFGLVGAPIGASMTTGGDFSWTPSEEQGYSVYKFVVRVCDSATPALCDEEPVEVTVNEVNLVPVAAADAAATAEDTAVVIDVLANDSDADGDALTVSSVTQGSHGSVTIGAEGSEVTYTPDADYHGSDSFTYTANDGTEDSAAATVTVTVAAVNDAPVAQAQAVKVDEDGSVAITLTGSDVDDDALTFTVADGPDHGTLSGTAPALTYTPAAGYDGSDAFTFTVSDGKLESAAATVSITVGAVNHAPVADGQTLTVTQGEVLAITLTGSDVDGDALTFVVVDGPDHGTLSGTAPVLTYTPAAGYDGSDAFTFTVSDGSLESAEATVAIVVEAAPPSPAPAYRLFVPITFRQN